MLLQQIHSLLLVQQKSGISVAAVEVKVANIVEDVMTT
jgi:hypothetical protein